MKVLVIFALLLLILCNGCDLFSIPLTNINGWDLSACAEGFGLSDVCIDLFTDNADKILGEEDLGI